MKVLAILQNQWFHDPERMRDILARGMAKGLPRHDFIARTLFMGCRTGRVLKAVFGAQRCREIIWEEASPAIGGKASSAFPADLDHLRAVLEEIKPDLVLAFGRIASDALAVLVPPEKLLIGPHPTARGLDTLQRLRSMHDRLIQESEGKDG